MTAMAMDVERSTDALILLAPSGYAAYFQMADKQRTYAASGSLKATKKRQPVSWLPLISCRWL